MRIGGKEERKSTIVSEEEDGGREGDEGLRSAATSIIKVSLLMTLAVEDLQAPAGPADTRSTHHDPTEDDTTWLPGDAILDPSSLVPP